MDSKREERDLCYNRLMNKKVITAAKKRVLFLPHAVQQMSRVDRMISPSEVVKCIFDGEVIEEYLDDARGESCLMYHKGDRIIHVVCAPKDEYLAIVTAYLPDPALWTKDFKERIV